MAFYITPATQARQLWSQAQETAYSWVCKFSAVALDKDHKVTYSKSGDY